MVVLTFVSSTYLKIMCFIFIDLDLSFTVVFQMNLEALTIERINLSQQKGDPVLGHINLICKYNTQLDTYYTRCS